MLFLDRSSVSLSDLPINPPAPDTVTYTKVDENAPLSLPPSPFLSKEVYLQCHKNRLEQVIKPGSSKWSPLII